MNTHTHTPRQGGLQLEMKQDDLFEQLKLSVGSLFPTSRTHLWPSGRFQTTTRLRAQQCGGLCDHTHIIFPSSVRRFTALRRRFFIFVSQANKSLPRCARRTCLFYIRLYDSLLPFSGAGAGNKVEQKSRLTGGIDRPAVETRLREAV